MCADGQEELGSRNYYFNPDVKCCSYVPVLHNFLVGRILSDTGADLEFGKTSVQKSIADRVGVEPLGLAPPPVYSLLYNNNERAFGRSRRLLCPHYIEDGGRCGIWRHRNSTCSTWFCKHVRGRLGEAFWRESLHPLLQIVEKDLARWCALELCLSDDALQQSVDSALWASVSETVTAEALDNKVDEKMYRRMWGEWLGREHEFFVGCADIVDPLSWAEVLAICGPAARAYAQLTERAFARLTSEEIPAALNVGSFELVQIQQGRMRVSTYSGFDTLEIPGALMELFPYFNGRPTKDALAAIADERGVCLDHALVRKMVDFGLLNAEPNRETPPSNIPAPLGQDLRSPAPQRLTVLSVSSPTGRRQTPTH
jgi:hypothetical protein